LAWQHADDMQCAAAAMRTAVDIAAGHAQPERGNGLGGRWLQRGRLIEGTPGFAEQRGFAAIGEQAVVADQISVRAQRIQGGIAYLSSTNTVRMAPVSCAG